MTNVLKKFSICEIPPRDNLRSQTNDDYLICVEIKSNLCYSYSKEALIKSDVQITPSDFSSDCAKATQESCRISSGFCAIWRKICK